MSDSMKKFKKMMQLAKENQQRFEKELKRLDCDDATLITQEELDAAEKNNKSLDEMNKETIDELNKVSISSVRSSSACLRDISRSLSEISKSLMNIEGYLTDNKEADWND